MLIYSVSVVVGHGAAHRRRGSDGGKRRGGWSGHKSWGGLIQPDGGWCQDGSQLYQTLGHRRYPERLSLEQPVSAQDERNRRKALDRRRSRVRDQDGQPPEMLRDGRACHCAVSGLRRALQRRADRAVRRRLRAVDQHHRTSRACRHRRAHCAGRTQRAACSVAAGTRLGHWPTGAASGDRYRPAGADGVAETDQRRSRRDRALLWREASDRDCRALVAAGDRHRRDAGAPFPEREPSPGRQSRREDVAGGICRDRRAGGRRSRACGRDGHPRGPAEAIANGVAAQRDRCGANAAAVARAALSVRGDAGCRCGGVRRDRTGDVAGTGLWRGEAAHCTAPEGRCPDGSHVARLRHGKSATRRPLRHWRSWRRPASRSFAR